MMRMNKFHHHHDRHRGRERHLILINIAGVVVIIAAGGVSKFRRMLFGTFADMAAIATLESGRRTGPNPDEFNEA